MALRDRITNYQLVATATLATVATLKNKELLTVAKVATVAVADKEKKEIYSATSPQARTWTAGNPYTCACGEITGWRLDDQALCPVCFHDQTYGPDPVNDKPVKELPIQISCKAGDLNGLIVSTDGKHCLDWQDHFCKDCELYKIQQRGTV